MHSCNNSCYLALLLKLPYVKSIYSLFVLLCCAGTVRADFYTISGTVRNQSGEPLAYVGVSVIDLPHLNTRTDILGRYSIRITEGTYVLVFTMKDFKTHKIPVTVNYADLVQNCILEHEETELKSYKVSVKKTDRSEDIIRLVIAGKYRFIHPKPYTVDAYIKATEVSKDRKGPNDSASHAKADLSMAEIFTTVHVSPPDKLKEERSGVDIRGNKDGLFYLSHTEGDFNFYKNLTEIPALSESPMLSPLSNSGLLAYRYKMLKVFYENGIKYYKIRVTPGPLGNALMSGELTIQDSAWTVRSLRLSLPVYHLAEYDFFEVVQEFEYKDSVYALKRMEFVYRVKEGRQMLDGRTVVYYTNYRYHEQFKKKFFRSELSSTALEAYERDSVFWVNRRLEPLTEKELAYIHKTDSIKAVQLQKHWQDSADREFNRITFKKVLFTGMAFYKRSQERYWSFQPLIFSYSPIFIAGPRLRYWVSYEKTSKHKKELHVTPSVNYGLYNKDLKGSLNVFRLYNPFSRAYYTLSTGREFGVINPYSSWVRGFARENFYQHDYVHAYHRVELMNGLYLGTGMEYANRKSISNMKFDPRGDNLWGGNTNLTRFEDYLALYGSLSIYLVPFQKYIREPFQKQILGSKWPELSIRYRKGLHMLGSSIDFDYMEFVAEQEIKLGLAGISKYRITSGEFINTNSLQLIDYKFQRSIGPYFFANPMFSFQGIDTSFATLQRFYEGHYLHRFNGALINKIPLLRKLGLVECGGGGFLFSKERNMRYLEVYVGIEKMLKLFKERVRIGVFYVANINNAYRNNPEIKFTVEVYDKIRNRWPY